MFGRNRAAVSSEPEPSQVAADVLPSAADPDLSPRPRSSRRRRLVVRITAILLLLMMAMIAWLAWSAPLGKALEPLEAPALVIQASDGTPVARRGPYKDAPVVASTLPPHIPNAFIAIEDRRFHSHLGLDPRGIARAMTVNLRKRAFVQGGSTITQQLAKVSFLTPDRSLKRKAQEALIALWLEAWLSKDEILSRYLSSVYFGDGAYGLRAAAMQYFSKPPEALTLGEAAMLAGLMKAPSRLAPTKNYAGARARGKLVIAAMKDEGLITDAEWNAARRARLNPGRIGLPGGSYFADWVHAEAASAAGGQYGEVAVRTTLDADMQRAAERILTERLARSSAGQGALVAMRPDGRILAMVGGIDYRKSNFNRATQARRQSGSAFKLPVYWAALQEGMRPDDFVLDEPVTIGDWTPQNYDDRYQGPISLADAFARSSNVAAARLTEKVGLADVRDAARDLGIESELVDDHTIALGTSETTLLELTAAYAACAGGKAPVKPWAVVPPQVRDERLFRRGGPPARAADMRRLLRGVVETGTGKAARLSVPAFGKTGTTQDYRDALFIGFVDNLVVGIWVGNDDNSPTRGVTGSNVPADIWRDFIVSVSPDIDVYRPEPPPPVRDLPGPENDQRPLLPRGLSDLLDGLDRDLAAVFSGEPDAARRLAERMATGDLDP
ncbi:MAG: PBP1A family penicillin-binding protein, partial [Pseudomonadota bacterium]